MRRNYRMSNKQLNDLFKACRADEAVSFSLIARQSDSTKSPQERASDAWELLGKELGFQHMTVRPKGNDPHDFSAEEEF